MRLDFKPDAIFGFRRPDDHHLRTGVAWNHERKPGLKNITWSSPLTRRAALFFKGGFAHYLRTDRSLCAALRFFVQELVATAFRIKACWVFCFSPEF
jgi:hypothetical protein